VPHRRRGPALAQAVSTAARAEVAAPAEAERSRMRVGRASRESTPRPARGARRLAPRLASRPLRADAAAREQRGRAPPPRPGPRAAGVRQTRGARGRPGGRRAVRQVQAGGEAEREKTYDSVRSRPMASTGRRRRTLTQTPRVCTATPAPRARPPAGGRDGLQRAGAAGAAARPPPAGTGAQDTSRPDPVRRVERHVADGEAPTRAASADGGGERRAGAGRGGGGEYRKSCAGETRLPSSPKGSRPPRSHPRAQGGARRESRT